MRRGLLALLFCLGSLTTALAGPNAGGTIIVHNPSLGYTTDNTNSYCGLGTPPPSCSGADVELDGSSSLNIQVWKVYAAFWSGSSPRLRDITFGVTYPSGSTGIAIARWGACNADPNFGGNEFPGPGWPAPASGTFLIFQTTLTGQLDEIYWFAGYTKSAGAHNILALTPHPDTNLGGNFADDSTPPVLDPIAGYGTLGFDTPGRAACPIAPGACCDLATGSCTVTWQNECLPPLNWNGGDTCNPNPCLMPTGACCDPATGACTVTTQYNCPSPDSWQGAGTSCTPNPCPQPPATGACCISGNCSITTQAACAGQWLGANSSCAPNPCPCLPGRARGHASRSGGKPAGTTGRGPGVALPRQFSSPCSGTLMLNYDGTAENGVCWQYGGIVPCDYGAFAECYRYTGSICGIELMLTCIGNPCGPCDLYLWKDNGGIPGTVLSVTAGVNPCPVAIWPEISTVDFAIQSTNVQGRFWAGYWADWSAGACGYFVAADLNGPGGCPMTNIAPGIGYPTGWNSVSLVWGPTQAIGIGVWASEAVPVKETTWGRLKNIYR